MSAAPITPTATHQAVLGSEYKPNNAEPRRILVVGGAGYLGACVCRELLAAKTPATGQAYYVRCFDRLSYGDDGIKDLMGNDNFDFVKGDCRCVPFSIRRGPAVHRAAAPADARAAHSDVGAVMTALDNIDAVIMLAAIVGDPACAKVRRRADARAATRR